MGFYERNEMPTLQKITEELKENSSFKGSTESFRRVIRQIGFTYGKVDGRKFLLERSNIVAARTNFLRDLRQLRQRFWTVVYLDETWVGNNAASEEEAGMQPAAAKGSGVALLHAGTKDGFVENAELVFEAKNEEYHSRVNAAVFEEWFKNKLLPNIAPKSAIVMDNAPCHSVLLEEVPTLAWKKAAISEWLVRKGVQPSQNLLKAELYELAKRCPVAKAYRIDAIAEEAGHKVVRLPAHHCQYNPLELIWGQVRSYVARRNAPKTSDLQPLVKEALSRVTAQDWRQALQQVEQLQEEDTRQDIAVDMFFDYFNMNLSENSEEELSD